MADLIETWLRDRTVDPGETLTVKQAAKVAGVGERTLRRWIADGTLTPDRVDGLRGPEHRIAARDLASVCLDRKGALDRRQTPSPVATLAREIAALREQVEEQTATIRSLESEVHDSKAQLSQLQDQIRALPAPRRWWPFGKRQV